MSLALDRAGTGASVLLIHGLGGERHVWEPIWPVLTARYDVITVDVPGFGASDPLPAGADVTPPALARAIAGALPADFVMPHVVGNSLGAWIGLELARQGRARSVTALCPAGFWVRKQGPLPPGPRRLVAAARPLVPLAFTIPAIRNRALSGVMAHPERLSRKAATRVVTAYLGAPGYVAVQTAMRANRLEDGDGIDVPVTIAWAEHDRLVGPQRMPFTPTRTVRLVDAGHVPMWDVPERIVELVIEDAG